MAREKSCFEMRRWLRCSSDMAWRCEMGTEGESGWIVHTHTVRSET